MEGHHPLFSTISVHGNTSVRGHFMWVLMLTEPMQGPQLPTAVVPIATYGEQHLGSLRLPICLCKLGACSIEIPSKTGWPGHPCHWWSSQQGPHRNPIAVPNRYWSWRPWTSKASGNGPNLSRNRPESCCSNRNTCLPTATWTWVKLLWSNIKLR